MRALVTGHEGFVGRHLVPKLARAGYEVHGTEDLEDFLKSPLARRSGTSSSTWQQTSSMFTTGARSACAHSMTSNWI